MAMKIQSLTYFVVTTLTFWGRMTNITSQQPPTELNKCLNLYCTATACGQKCVIMAAAQTLDSFFASWIQTS